VSTACVIIDTASNVSLVVVALLSLAKVVVPSLLVVGASNLRYEPCLGIVP
jgi:hypothetical protein